MEALGRDQGTSVLKIHVSLVLQEHLVKDSAEKSGGQGFQGRSFFIRQTNRRNAMRITEFHKTRFHKGDWPVWSHHAGPDMLPQGGP